MIKEDFIMLPNYKFIFSLFKYLLFLTSISIFLIFCDNNNNEYTGPWKEVPTPGGEGELSACYFTSSDNGWACGWTWNDEEQRGYPLLIHWNGTEWEEYPYGGWFNNEQFWSIDLDDILFSSPDDGWCVGTVIVSVGGETFGFILRYNGNNWYLFKSHFEGGIYDLSCISKDDIWMVVTETNNGSALYHWDGNEIKRCDTSPRNPGIYDIAFSSSTEGLAVGNYYSVYHWDGTSWTEIDSDPSRPFVNNAVSYYEPNSALIAGDERRARWRNGIYQYEYCWNYGYEDIHFSHPDEGWMIGCGPNPSKPIGYGGYIWHWDGKNWIKMEEPPEMVSWAVFSVDYNNAWIVGESCGMCDSWKYEP